ncbi:MAG TPA: metalloregulator ArsR/SmtB family transcription factor [Acidimicrobiales bacterium]|nr:metalloregulator ArsR/SmtB family transcription factor [Acidimicrobiales bacterium]
MENSIDQVFQALADSTRRDIVRRSLDGEHSVSTLAHHYPMSFAAVQKHVSVLERAELITKRRHGREQLVRGNVQTIRGAYEQLEQLEQVWRSRIGRMEEILTEDLNEGALT